MSNVLRQVVVVVLTNGNVHSYEVENFKTLSEILPWGENGYQNVFKGFEFELLNCADFYNADVLIYQFYKTGGLPEIYLHKQTNCIDGAASSKLRRELVKST